MKNETRCFRLRELLGETQEEFSARLRVTQSTINRLETGQPEAGPISLLLDKLEADIAASRSLSEPSRLAEMLLAVLPPFSGEKP